jgi:hypothetical protein
MYPVVPSPKLHTQLHAPPNFPPTNFPPHRNFLKSEEADFLAVSEYTPYSQVTRARSLFFQGRTPLLLYTERAHFYHRYSIRGVQVHLGSVRRGLCWAGLGRVVCRARDVAAKQSFCPQCSQLSSTPSLPRLNCNACTTIPSIHPATNLPGRRFLRTAGARGFLQRAPQPHPRQRRPRRRYCRYRRDGRGGRGRAGRADGVCDGAVLPV